MRAHRHVFPVKGQSQSGKTILGRPTKQDFDHGGQKIPSGVDLWPIGSDTAKEKIYGRLKIATPGPGCMHFPHGLPDEYYQQLTAERRVPKYHRGYLKHVWEKDAGARNEALDLEVYAYAAAIYAGVTRVNWDKLEAALHATANDLFVQADAQNAVQTSTPEPAEAPQATPARQPLPAQRKSNWMKGYR
jgi:phage terminase large subunit GpA-like protein